MRCQQPGNAAVAVGDRVDGEQVEDQGADQDERMRAAFALGVLVAAQQLRQEELGVPRRGRGEDDLPPVALVGDDQVLVGLEVAATPVAVMEEQAV